MKRQFSFAAVAFWSFTVLAVMSQIGCIARPYARSNVTTAAGRGGKSLAHLGSSSRSSDTTFPNANTTFPNANTTYPHVRPRGNTTYPQIRARGNTTYPTAGTQGNSTFPQIRSRGNTTFPATRNSGNTTYPTFRPRGNTTFPQSSVPQSTAVSTTTPAPQKISPAPEYFVGHFTDATDGDETPSDESADDDPTTETVAAKEAVSDASDSLDWPFWRGPNYDGISRETGLPDTLDFTGGEGSNLAWKRDDLGGRSTPIVLNGKVYMLVRDKPSTSEEGEKVVCLDLATGDTLWETRFNVWLSDVPDTRVGWSSVVGDPETGNVYALGVCCHFVCLNGETGETIWSMPLHEQFGMLSTYGGRTNFPVVCDDLVIISGIVIGWGDMAKPAHRFIGFNKQTGEVVWFASTHLLPYDTTYGSPALAVIGGQKMLVIGSGDGDIWAIQPRTGKAVWNYPFSRRGLNTTPVVSGDRVFYGHSEENNSGTEMGAVVCLNGAAGTGNISKTGEVWRVPELMIGKSSPILVDDRLYCVDDGAKLFILDPQTGEEVVKKTALGTVMRASLLYADGKIYAITADGRWYVLKPDEKKGVATVSKGRLDFGEETNASPIVSHGNLLIHTSHALYCFTDAAKEHGVEPAPQQPAEAAVGDDPTPAQLQLIPAELLLKPGESVTYKVRLFNARGQLLGDADDVTFALDGPGTIAEDGTFTASPDANHVATTVTAKVGDITGTARVRSVPDLPWTFDFEGMTDLPVTWVGARYRHVIRHVDGSDVAVKITTIPKGTRSRAWFGPSDLSNYTIQAEVKGASGGANKLPDIGLIAQGYAIDMQGENQKLQIRSWVSHDQRTQKTIEFPWKPDTWYVMKLQASVEGDQAVLRGKVWPRDEQEPADWTLEVIDSAPNRTGSPGLFGNATNAELFLDNITVTPNAA